MTVLSQNTVGIRFSFTVSIVFSTCFAEQQATPKQVEKTIDTVKENRIPTVFCESTVNPKAQLQVAKESGAKFGGVFYVDSLSPPNGPASTYLKLLEYNVSTLIKGLEGK